MRSILIIYFTLCFTKVFGQNSIIKSFTIISCQSEAIYKFNNNQFFLESYWESKDGSYQTLMKVRLNDSDLIKLNSALNTLMSKPGNELLLNSCVQDGFSFKVYLYSDSLEKKLFVGNYYDERIDRLTSLIEMYLLKSDINIYGYHIGYGSKSSIENLIKSQESCLEKVPIAYQKHLLDNWCELPVK